MFIRIKSSYIGLKALTSLINLSSSICARAVIYYSRFVIVKMFIKYSVLCLLLTALVDISLNQFISKGKYLSKGNYT